MRKLLHILFAASAAVILMTACGHNRDNETDRLVEEQNTQLNAAMERHDYATMSAIADSMALYVDDLTPDETVSVLLAFLEIHNRAVADGNADADLETLRKYVDVYDIAVANNPEDIRAAFARAREVNPRADFEQAAANFRHALAEYDAVRTYGEDAPAEESASTDTATVRDARADSTATVTTEEVTSTVRDIE